MFEFLDENLPYRIAKSLLPKRNRLIFFEVTDKSYHQVILTIKLLHCFFKKVRFDLCIIFIKKIN